MKKNYTLLLLFVFSLCQGQLIVDNTTQTPAQLVQNVLSNNGLTAFNIKFNGSVAKANTICDQIGQFSTGTTQTNLILTDGLLLTTGKATVALGPNNTGSFSILSNSTVQGDVDLALLSTQQIKNVAILEFDFLATGTLLSFQFVFGSEEYPEYVNSAYNDVFGLFISGPGITGIYSGNAKNIAAIPNTEIPVSINTVNNGLNNNGVLTSSQYSAFYYNNSTVGLNPNLSLNTTIQYDGFTKPISAYANLQLGGTYHIKYAIANVLDNSFDSAVFIKNFNLQTLGVNQNEKSTRFLVYPNPTNSMITIINSNKVSIYEIIITDVNGRIVERLQQEFLNDATIDISKLNRGVYFLEVISNGLTTTQKIIKN